MNKNSDILERVTIFPKISLQTKLMTFILIFSLFQINANDNNLENSNIPPDLNEAVSEKEIVQQQIQGKVTDENGTPLPGVSVIEKGTSNGATTDFDGNYNISVSNETAILEFSYLGFASEEVVVANQTTINISLAEDAESLDEIVVTALGISRKKKSLGYSVTTVDGDAVSTVKESNVISSLAGKVAGVVVTRNTSGAGGSTIVKIRGNNSLAGNNEPLYVVDGVPIDNQNSVNSIFDTEENSFHFNQRDYGNGISDINADDIESMSILKGPNAAALYGSRASNGVVLITTKKGTAGKGIGVSFSSSATFENPMLLPDYQNEYGRGTDGNHPVLPGDNLATQVNVVKMSDSWGPRFDGSSQLEFNGQQRAYEAQPNNVKDFFETGQSLINTIALTGGTEKASFRFSSTNSDISSIIPNSKLKRNNFSLRGTAQLSDKLSVDAKVNYFIQDASNRPIQGGEGVMGGVLTMPRNIITDDLRTYQDTENPIDPLNPFAVIAANLANPFWMQNENSNGDKRTRTSGFVKIDYKFNDWLSAFARVGTDNLNHNLSDLTAYGNHFFSNGNINFRTVDRSETNYDFLFLANKNLNERFNISANFGGNGRHTSVQESRINGANFKIPGRYFLNNTEAITAEQSDLIEKKVNSLYGSASIGFDDMIYLDLTARNDWSSTLPAENRSYFYTSASLAVLLHKAFSLDRSVVNLLKLRGSAANVGNDTDPLQVLNSFNIAAAGYLGNISINRENIRFSDSLRPEDIGTFEVGLEFALFGNRLYGDMAYYDITTKDLIFDVPVDPGTGYSFFRENIGELSNKGFELSLGGTPVSTKNFKWDINFNYSTNTNKLVSLIEGQDLFPFTKSNGGEVDVRAQVGSGFGDIYTTDWLRNDAGDYILTADGRPQATSERTKQGNYQPDFTGGVANTFKYKNFTLSALIDFRIGGEIYSATESQLDNRGVSKRTLQYRETGVVLDGVADQGDGTFIPNTNSISAQEYWQAVSGIASEYVYDQTNVRLREVSISYKFPNSILSSTKIQNARLSLIGRNLFFLHKKVDNFDPESSYSTGNFSQGVISMAVPSTRSIGLSLNVNF